MLLVDGLGGRVLAGGGATVKGYLEEFGEALVVLFEKL